MKKRIRKVSDWTVAGLVLSVAAAGVLVGLVALQMVGSRALAPSSVRRGVGEVLQAAGYNLKVASVRQDDHGDSVYRPGDGYRYVIVTVTITNTGKAPIALAPVVQTSIRGMGASYAMAQAPLANPFSADLLEAGGERTGELSYVVPMSAHDLEWVFEPGAGLASVRVLLGH